MQIPDRFVYLSASVLLLPVWLYCFGRRRDLRHEMLAMSVCIGLLSVATSYHWWTIDWWRPLTVTGTKVGIEDFITGFVFGGLMAALYEVIFRERLYRRSQEQHHPGAFTIGLLLILLMTASLYFGSTTFVAATISLVAASFVMLLFRPDLFVCALLSGILTTLISLPVYYFILAVSPQWIDRTYLFQFLSGIRITGIPMEELIFWFLAGLVFGPFYEYWKNERFRKLPSRT